MIGCVDRTTVVGWNQDQRNQEPADHIDHGEHDGRKPEPRRELSILTARNEQRTDDRFLGLFVVWW